MCKGIYVSASKVEPGTLKAIEDYIDNKKYIASASTSNSENKKDISDIDSEIKALKKALDKYFDLFETTEDITNSYFVEKVNSLNRKIELLENKKTAILYEVDGGHVESVLKGINKFNDVYSQLTNPEKKEFIRDIVKTVRITKDKKVESIEMFNGQVIRLLS